MKKLILLVTLASASIAHGQNTPEIVLINSTNLMSYDLTTHCELESNRYRAYVQVTMNLNQPNLPVVMTWKEKSMLYQDCRSATVTVDSNFDDLLYLLNQIENKLDLVDTQSGESPVCYRPMIQGILNLDATEPVLRKYKEIKHAVRCQ